MSNSVLILNDLDVSKCLTIANAIEIMEDAFLQLSNQKCKVPMRSSIQLDDKNSTGLFMPAYSKSLNQIAIKTVVVNGKNAEFGLPIIHALINVFDSITGTPIAIINGENITGLRTGAASGLATKLLSTENSKIAAIIGAGVQGRYQLRAVCCVRNIEKVYVFDVEHQKADQFCKEMSDELGIDVINCTDNNCLLESQVICTSTASPFPVFDESVISAGTHINAIGSFRPDMQEIPAGIIYKSKLIVDSTEAVLKETGDVLVPIKEGIIDESHIYAELGEVVGGKKDGRVSENEITIFKSVGNAIQDLVCANAIIENAVKLNIGSYVNI